MRIKYICLAMAVLFLAACGYKPITGTVVDAETGKPIEGAVVLVEWTKAEGVPGLTSTKSFKVIEKLTDKDGKVTIEGISDISVDPPDLTVYKKGYVAWNNESIFPEYKKRTDFKWKNGYVFKLERFKPEYSYVEHTSFIHSAINLGLGEGKK
ncbi:MAG: carboxypeptidase regulatory-like domain-containing protein, partial [Nitrospirae bacterium]